LLLVEERLRLGFLLLAHLLASWGRGEDNLPAGPTRCTVGSARFATRKSPVPPKSVKSLDELLADLDSDRPAVSRRARERLVTCRDPQTLTRLLERIDGAGPGPDEWLTVPLLSSIGTRLADPDRPPVDARLATRALLNVAYGTDEVLVSTALDAMRGLSPVPPRFVVLFAEKLRSRSYMVTSSALRGLVELPPRERARWVRRMLDRLNWFKNNSEWSWIVECLAPHFAQHRARIEKVLRAGLTSTYAFGPHSTFICLHQLGPRATALIPDVLAYIGRQSAFTSEEPHLIHLDPGGATAIPGLIRLLGHAEETVRYQAADELAAYGPLAAEAVPALLELANKKRTKRDLRLDADAARRALAAIQRPAE
jgi:hypothetical protein